MLPYVNFFGRILPSYGILSVVGFGAGLILAALRCSQFDLDWRNGVYICSFGGIGAVIGAKVLYLVTVFPQFTADLPVLRQNPALFIKYYISGGMVFYGGLLGAIGGATFCAHYFSLRLMDYFPALVPIFPLIHAVGRIGCFLVGCCYGAESEWGIAFTDSPIAPNHIKLLPVQLIEAGAEVLICLFLLWYVRQKPASVRLLAAYFLMYAPVRFVLEFFRGDVSRGFLGGMSTSQWISIAVFAAGVILMCSAQQNEGRKKRGKTCRMDK